MVRLPKRLYQPTLQDLKPGEGGYTVPWALQVNEHGDCFLDTSFMLDKEPAGTVKMRVERDKEGGYRVALTNYLYHATPFGETSTIFPIVGFL